MVQSASLALAGTPGQPRLLSRFNWILHYRFSVFRVKFKCHKEVVHTQSNLIGYLKWGKLKDLLNLYCFSVRFQFHSWLNGSKVRKRLRELNKNNYQIAVPLRRIISRSSNQFKSRSVGVVIKHNKIKSSAKTTQLS